VLVPRFLKTYSLPAINKSLRLKVTLGIVVPMVLMLSGFIALEYTSHRNVLLENLSGLAAYNGRLITESLQHAMLTSDFAEVQRILDTAAKNENFRVVYLLDTSGRVIFSPNQEGAGIRLDNRDRTCQPCHNLPPAERPSGIVATLGDGQTVFRSMQPIENSPACSACHDPQDRLVGLLLTDISVEPFETAFVADLRQNLLWGGVFILASALFANLMMERLVIRRLQSVGRALAEFGSGKRDFRLPSGSGDEIRRLEAEFNDMSRRIQAEEAENQALSEKLRRQAKQQQELLKSLITAQESERKRVARELHDELGQSLSGMALHSEVLNQFIPTDPRRALQQLSLIRELIGKTAAQMYELILALRPSVLDDLGLAAALRSHAERTLQGSGISFTLDASGLPGRLPASIETALYRIFQEALTNVVRHSGASQVSITLVRQDGVFQGEIVDDGRGFNPEVYIQPTDDPHGLGLLGMCERVTQCDGHIEIISRPGEGTRVHIRIPLENLEHE
jgi:signal transduction histidine kinase